MSLRKFNSKAEKLVKKSEIKFVNFIDNRVTLKNGSVVNFTPVSYRGKMRLAISK